MPPAMRTSLFLTAVVLGLLELPYLVGASQQIIFPPLLDKSGTPGFTVTIGGTLSMSNGSEYQKSSLDTFQALKLLQDHINTQTRVANNSNHQCLVPEGSDIWKLHCTKEPNNQCGYRMLEGFQPTINECWAACEKEADCAAMEWEKGQGCWRVPEEIFSVCVLYGFIRRYDRTIQWRQPIFATRSMDRISVNFEIQDDQGSPDLAIDLYTQMFASGNYDAFLGPQATEVSELVFQELGDSNDQLLVTHSEHPAIKRKPDPFTAEADVVQGADSDVVEVTLGWTVESGSFGPLAPTPTQLGAIVDLENLWDIGVGRKTPGLFIRHLMLSTLSANSVLSLVLRGAAGDIRKLQQSSVFQSTCSYIEEWFFFFEPPSGPACSGPLHFNTSTFTVTPLVEGSFANGLDIVKEEGATTIAFITFQRGLHQRACKGAEDYARSKNFTVLGSSAFIQRSDWHTAVRSAMVQSPDVLVGCGNLEDVGWLTTSMRALSFNPKALLLMEGAEDAYIANVGAGNAVNLMQPAVASLSDNYQSLAFIGTETSLHQLFLNAHNKTPIAAVSFIEAAVLGILGAYSAANAGKSATLEDLRTSIVGISVPSLIGTLYWGFSGQVLNTNKLTIQTRPIVGAKSSPVYTELERFVVGLDEPVKYPLKSWTEREASVYPCKPGYVFNPLQWTCEACPPGTFRGSTALKCRWCGVGFYAELPGLQECRVCEEGMKCAVIGLDRMPDAMAGWYRLQTLSHVPPQTEAYYSKAIGSAVYVKCDPEHLCLGNNTCSGHNSGILCAQCEEGYTATTGGNYACGKCPENNAVPILYFASQLFVYLLLALMIVKVFSNTPSSLFMSHSVMLRIFVDYLHLASTTYLASSYSVNHIEETILEVLKSPMETDIMYDCLLRKLGYETYQSSTIVALALVPTLLALNMFLVLVYGFAARIFSPSEKGAAAPESPSRRASPSSLPYPSPRRGSSGSIVSLPSMDSFTVGPQSSLSRGSSMESVTNASRAFRRGHTRQLRHKHGLGQDIYRSIKEDMVSVWGVVQKPIALTRHTIVKRTASAFIRSSTVWVYILLPTTMQLLLEGVACVGLDTYRLAADLNVICNSQAHQRWFTVSMVCMTGYGVVLPALVFIKLRLVRNKLMEAKTREKYGFLYVGYQPEYYWFEVVVMIRKVLIYALAALPGPVVKNLGLLTLAFLFLILHAILRPFDDRDFYALDKFQFFALLAILAPSLSTLVTHSEALRDTNQVWLKDFSKWITDGFVIVAHLIVVFQLCYNLMRNLVIKQLIFMQECFPEKLSNFQKILLRIFEGVRRPRVRFDPNTNFIDCSGLTPSQRKFVVRAFKRTLKQYMIFFERLQDVDTHEDEYWRNILKFHTKEDNGNSQSQTQIIFKPAWLSIAIRKGFQACQSARFTRAEELVREMTMWQRFLARLSVQTRDEDTFGRLDSEIPDRTMRRTEVIAYDSVLRSGVTVEELQIALMRLEPLILEGREELYRFQTREAWVEAQLARHKDAIMNVIKLKTNQADWLSRIQAAAGNESEFSFEELREILINAAEESDMDFLGIEQVVSTVDVLSPSIFPTTAGGYSQWLVACSRFGDCEPCSPKLGTGTIQEEEGDGAYKHVWEMPSTLANRATLYIETYEEVKAETDDLLDKVLELKMIQGLLRREALNLKEQEKEKARRSAGGSNSNVASNAASRNSSPQQRREVRLQLPPHRRDDQEAAAEPGEAEEQTHDDTLDLVELLQWSDVAGAGSVTDSPHRGNVLLREGEAGSRDPTLRSLPSRLPIDARTDWWAHRSVAEPVTPGQPQVSISTMGDEEYDDESSDEDGVEGSREVQGFFPTGESSASIGDDQQTTQPPPAAAVSPSLPRQVPPADRHPRLRPTATEPPSGNSSARVHPPPQDVNWFGASLASHTPFPPQTGSGLLSGALVQPPSEEGEEPPIQNRFLSWLGVGTSAIDQSASQPKEGKRNLANWPFGEGMIDMTTLPDNTAGLGRPGEEDLEGGQPNDESYGPAALVTL